MSTTKIAFPPPPPTTNILTSQQRTQLLRTTKKLGRVLGSTPHLIDANDLHSLAPLHVHLPFRDERHLSYHDPSARASTESISSMSSSGSRSSTPSLKRISSLSSSSSSILSTSTSSGSVRSTHYSDIKKFDSSPTRKPPILRLASTTPSPILETIPASPDSPPSYYSRSNEDLEDTRYTIRPTPTASPRDSMISAASPSFTIPSPNSSRRQKMDRLRRKLGDGVPIDLVFPPEMEEPASIREKALPPPPSTPRTPTSSSIAASRDSLSSPSPHRAHRRVPPPTAPHRRIPSHDQQKLTAIIESPDEHGSGCIEEFGIKRSGSESSLAFGESEWYTSDNESNVKVWSTRKGYEGWLEPSRGHQGHRSSWGSARAGQRKGLTSFDC